MPIWQRMKHKPRLVVAGQPHHVRLRSNNRRLLFASHRDRTFWLECVRRALDATKCQLHQMTLMTSYVLCIITPPDEDALSDMVKRACQRYAQTRNKLRTDSGRLFQVGFESEPLVGLDQLQRSTLCNDATALRVGRVTDPFVHKWSTVALHGGRPEGRAFRPLWTASTWYAALGKTPEERVLAFRRAMVELLERGDLPPVDDALAEDAVRYSRRIERPDGTCARERQLQYGPKP